MTSTTPPPSDYMSVAEVATALHLSKMTVYRMCENGQLAHIRTGRTGRIYRVLRADFERHAQPVRHQTAPVTIPGQTEICTRPNHACATPGAGPCNGLPKQATA